MRHRTVNCPNCGNELIVTNEVKNHIHNTLGFSKESLQELIKETVDKEAKKLINSDMFNYIVKNHIHDLVRNSIRGDNWTLDGAVKGYLKKIMAEMVFDKFKIDVSLKEEEITNQIKNGEVLK